MTPLSESDFTIFCLFLLMIDGLIIPVIRHILESSEYRGWSRFLAYTTLIPVVSLTVGQSGFDVASSYTWGVFSLSWATILYNRWYLLATDDQLCEGIVWPHVRDYALKVLDVLETVEK